MTFNEAIGLNSIKLGNVNAAFQALVLNKKNEVIAICMDTPNNAAYAFATIEGSVKIVSKYSTFTKNKDIKSRMGFVLNEEDAAYHSQYVKAIK